MTTTTTLTKKNHRIQTFVAPFPDMDEHTRKYHTFISNTLNDILKSASDSNVFDSYYNQLIAVVPTYGLSLNELTLLLDIIIDPSSSFKNSQKNKILNLFHCRDLIDFNTVLKIVSVFKVPSYYNTKVNRLILSPILQKKLSQFLLKQFVNIKWEKKFIKLLNLLFNLLSIGYLRLNIGLFLIYLLNISSSIDSKYNKRFFYDAKKFDTLLDIYEMDQKNTLPLVLNFMNFLNSNNKSETFALIHSKYQLVLSDIKISKDIFGKINISFINSLLNMKRLNSDNEEDLNFFESNVKSYLQLLVGLNSLSLTSNTSKKRKYLEDNSLAEVTHNISMYILNSTENLMDNVISKPTDHKDSTISVLKYLYMFNAEEKNYIDLISEVGISNMNIHLIYYSKLATILINSNVKTFNDCVVKLLRIKDGRFRLTSDMSWLFQGIATFLKYHPHSSLLPTIENIISGKIHVEFDGSNDEKYNLLNLYEFIGFLEPNYKKYENILNQMIDSCFKSNNKKNFTGLVRLASNWTGSSESFNHLLKEILNRFTFGNSIMLDEILVLCKIMQLIPYEDISIENLVLKPELVACIIFSGDLLMIDSLADHVFYCKNYYRDYGLAEIGSNRRLQSIKDLHNSYVMDLCNYLWRNKVFDISEDYAGRGFGLSLPFVDQITYRSTDIVHNSITWSIRRGLLQGQADVTRDNDELKNRILQELQKRSYHGIVNFLKSSIRSLNEL